MGLNYYRILDIPQNASDEDIRRAYYKLALQWHPDKHQQNSLNLEAAKTKFQLISEAYDVLKDPTKRQMFDNGMHNQEQAPLAKNYPMDERNYEYDHSNDFFNQMQQQHFGFAGMSGSTMMDSFRMFERMRQAMWDSHWSLFGEMEARSTVGNDSFFSSHDPFFSSQGSFSPSFGQRGNRFVSTNQRMYPFNFGNSALHNYSHSTETVTINGRRTTKITSVDDNGNVTVKTIRPDGSINISVNGQSV